MTPTVPHLCLKKMVIVVDGGVFFSNVLFERFLPLIMEVEPLLLVRYCTKHPVPEMVYEDIQNFMNYAGMLA